MVSLNLGCGEDKRGEIRIDKNSDRKGLNLISDAHYLPIRDRVINYVFCKSVLEHLKNPFKGLSEMKRISKNRIIVIVPNVHHWNRIVRGLINPYHLINRKTLHLQAWDGIAFKLLVNQVKGLEIFFIGWEDFNGRMSKPSLLFGKNMKVGMRVS